MNQKMIAIIDKPTQCWNGDKGVDCPFCYDTLECMASNERIDVSYFNRPINCPLKPYKDAIPIEWIEKWLDKTTGTRDGEDISQLPEQLKYAIGMINLMEMEWEKENEID